MYMPCLFCGADPAAPDHWRTCDGQQGWPEDGLSFEEPGEGPHHDGETYDAEQDYVRLNAQTLRVWTVMRDGTWMTLREISQQTGDPEASVSARLRDLRKAKFGGHVVERVRAGYESGLFLYRLVLNASSRVHEDALDHPTP